MLLSRSTIPTRLLYLYFNSSTQFLESAYDLISSFNIISNVISSLLSLIFNFRRLAASFSNNLQNKHALLISTSLPSLVFSTALP